MAKSDASEKRMQESLARVARDTCLGDVRDFLLDRFKHDKEPRPWGALPAVKQRELANSCTRAAEHLVGKVVEIVAAEGRRTIEGKLAQFAIKGDVVKAILTTDSGDNTLLALNHARGAKVLIVVAADTPFVGSRGTVTVTPDQGDLAVEAGEADPPDPEGEP